MRARATAAKAQAPHFVVTTVGRSVLKSEVWDPRAPLAIGYPLRWVLERTADGVRVRTLQGGAPEELSFKELSKKALPIGPKLSLKITPVQWLSPDGFTPDFVDVGRLDDDENLKFFGKMLAGFAAALVLVGLVSWLWPATPKSEEEIIPPQFAKVLLSPALKSAARETAAGQSGKGGSKEQGVAQVFRSQAIQKSAQKLIKGGAMALLSRSDLISGAGARAAVSNIFDAKSKLDRSQALSAQDIKTQSVAVGALGADGKGAGNTQGVGYGKGQGASIDGQGTSFVSLDTREAFTEEGLSLEEIGRVIHAHVAEIRYCYDSAMIRNPGVEGKVTAAFTINGQGHVQAASAKDSTVNDRGLEQCVLGKLTRWQFPKPKGGVNVAVTYPFTFKKLGN